MPAETEDSVATIGKIATKARENFAAYPSGSVMNSSG